MKHPNNLEEFATYVKAEGKQVFLFTADWCGDCQYIYPYLDQIEAENPAFQFIQVDRDQYIDVAKEWDIFGIPSLVVLENGQEIGRLVNRARKSKSEINEFLANL